MNIEQLMELLGVTREELNRIIVEHNLFSGYYEMEGEE